MKRWHLALLVLTLAATSVAAQDDAAELALVKRIFNEGLRSETAEERVEAVNMLVLSELPEGMELLRTALDTVTRQRVRAAKRLPDLDNRIDQLTPHGLVQGETPPQLQKAHEARATAAEHLERDRKVIAALQSGMGTLFAKLPPARRKAVLASLTRDMTTAFIPYRAVVVETLGRLTGPGATVLIVSALTADEQAVRDAAAAALLRQVQAAQPQALAPLEAAVEPMVSAVEKTVTERDRLYARYADLGGRFNKVTIKSRSPMLSAQASRLDRRRTRVGDALARAEATLGMLRQAMAALHAALPAPARREATRVMVARLEKAAKSPARLRLVELLGVCKGPGVVAALVPLASAPEPETRITAVDALGRQGDRAAVLSLAKALYDPCWQVRVVAVDALTAVGGVAAVDALLGAMPRAEGRLLHDVVEALHKLTGKNFHLNQKLWRQWWTANKADYTGPPQPTTAELARRSKLTDEQRKWMERTKGTSFYGIPTHSRHIVYILDISGSMNFPLRPLAPTRTTPPVPGLTGNRKIDQALDQLKASITSLPADATFNILFYNNKVHPWRKGQVEATPDNKEKALAFSRRVPPNGATNIFDALERAFQLAGRGTTNKHYPLAADTFYLLSDGQANRGRVVASDEMLLEVQRLNRYQRVVIHTVALGDDADTSFMKRLAGETGGHFVHFASGGRSD